MLIKRSDIKTSNIAKTIYFLAIFLSCQAFSNIKLSNRPTNSNNLVFPITRNNSNIMRVISYNIRGDFPIDHQFGHAWQLRKNQIRYLMQIYQADLIGLQEVNISYMPDLHKLFPAYDSIAFDVNDVFKDAVLLVKKSRFEIQTAEYFWISDKLPNKNPHLSILSILLDKQTNQKIAVFCTHFDSGATLGPDLRIQNAKILQTKLMSLPTEMPIVILGDFNFIITTRAAIKKNQTAYDILIENNTYDIRDAHNVRHYGPDGTWIGWRHDPFAAPVGTVGERLDHIFIKNCNATQEGVLNIKVNPMHDKLILPTDNDFEKHNYPSDHLPVIADLLINN